MRLLPLLLALACAPEADPEPSPSPDLRTVHPNGLAEIRPCPDGPGYLVGALVGNDGSHRRYVSRVESTFRASRQAAFDEDDVLIERTLRDFDAEGRSVRELYAASEGPAFQETYTRWADTTWERYRVYDAASDALVDLEATLDEQGHQASVERVLDGETRSFEAWSYDQAGNWTTWAEVDGDDVRADVRPEDADVQAYGTRTLVLDDEGRIVREEERWEGYLAGRSQRRVRELVRDRAGRVVSEWTSHGLGPDDATQIERAHHRVERVFERDGSLRSVRTAAYLPHGYRSWLSALSEYSERPLEPAYQGFLLLLMEEIYDHGLPLERRAFEVDLREADEPAAPAERTVLADGIPEDLPWEEVAVFSYTYDELGREVSYVHTYPAPDAAEFGGRWEGVWSCDPSDLPYDVDGMKIEAAHQPAWF